ncbi:MAG: ATP-binding cassette domain-containing protein [Lachnospiraceae bacterium]
MILSCQSVSKAFGTDEIIKEISFHIEDKEKAAIVGINGAGKSTLLKIITGELLPDDGQVILAKGKTIGYLAQNHENHFCETIYEEMLDVKKEIIALDKRMRETEQQMKHAKDEELEDLYTLYNRLQHEFEMAEGYRYKSEIAGVLKGLGFEESMWSHPISTLSGGQKTRVALGRLLLSRPDIILLDEPTNHLDMNSIQWLENYLLNYDGSVIIVCHDRYFLDKVVTKVIELDQGHARSYQGNYSAYMEKRAQLRHVMQREYEAQQREIRHQQEVITKLKSFNREKSIKRAESREKMLNKLERIEKPTEARTDMRITLTPQTESGNDVLTVEGLSKSFGTHTLFSDIDFDIKKGEKVALIGQNGTGKTTILKIINKYCPKDSGKVLLGSNVHIGYYDQEHQVLSSAKTIFDEISDSYPALTNTKIRNTLGAFLFTGDDVFKRICDLSGGERGRVSLAKLMLSNANFLILDEPTNHLDIHSKEILEQALQDYTGTVFYVSHDRYFINRTATRILELENESLHSYLGNYDNYLHEKEKQASRITAQAVTNQPKETSTAKLDWKQQKEEQAKQRKRENDLAKVEHEIEELENTLEELQARLSDPSIASDAARLLEITDQQNEVNEHLTALYEQWESLA